MNYPHTLFVSDVHLREESADVVLGQVLPGISEICTRNQIRKVICLGDFWHLRYRVPVALLNALRDALVGFGTQGIAWKILPGNHDQVDLAGRNALEVLDDLDNVCVHTNPGWDEDGLWVPYRTSLDAIAEAVATPKPSREYPDICYMHYGVRGALRNSRIVDTDGIEPHRFQHFAWVFCGHYHKQQELGRDKNILYIGSPYQTRADEAGDPKGILLWDGLRPVRVQQSWGARYVTGRIASLDEIDAMAQGDPGDQYRLVVAASVDLQKVGAKLEERGITRYTLTPEPQPHEVRLQVASGESVEAYAQAYLASKVDPAEQEAYWATFNRITESHRDGKAVP